MDELYLYPDCDTGYPVTQELDGDRLFGACGEIHDKLQEVQHDFDYPGFEMCFTGTSGTAIATALAGVNRAKTAPMNLAFTQVAKKSGLGANHHRSAIESSHYAEEKRGFALVFLDDFIASGETIRRTQKNLREYDAERNSMMRNTPREFDGVVVLSGVVNEDFHDVTFIIRPNGYG